MLPSHGGNLVGVTLGRAFGSMWDFFWPLLVPLLILLGIAFSVYVIRRVMDVG
jgi:hypothetical protein